MEGVVEVGKRVDVGLLLLLPEVVCLPPLDVFVAVLRLRRLPHRVRRSVLRVRVERRAACVGKSMSDDVEA